MKDYLKKLGKTKFQAYLVVTIINIVTFILAIRGDLQVDATVDKWMPLINLATQMLATVIYQHIEGSIDREAQKQQVYVMPGSAQPAAPVVEPTVDHLSVTEVMQLVGSVNTELNDYIKYIEEHPTEIGKEAALRYLKIKELLKSQGPILPQNDSEAK